MSGESDLLAEAEAIEQHLRVIRRLMRASLRADMRLAPLTRPQMHALEALVRHGAMSLKALSRHLALAHSTVSGIVDRLEHRGLVRREPDLADRRGVRLCVTQPVQEYMDDVLPVHRLEPLLAALHDASPEERRCVLEGVTALHRLLEVQTHEGESSLADRQRAIRGD
jgi:MarR family transcriptional regulator, organic hydroperoxide resistance regulator